MLILLNLTILVYDILEYSMLIHGWLVSTVNQIEISALHNKQVSCN